MKLLEWITHRVQSAPAMPFLFMSREAELHVMEHRHEDIERRLRLLEEQNEVERSRDNRDGWQRP